MKKNLNGKIAMIIVILLVFLYGIFGIPKGVTGTAFKDAIAQRIHLGLDLRGGAHLILQVVVKDAVKAEADNTVARIEQDMQSNKLIFGGIVPDVDSPQIIHITGTEPGKSSAVRNELNDRYGTEYEVAGGGADNAWTLTMKQSQLLDLQTKTVDQAIDTIRDRVDKLGVSEPVIQKYGLGDNQILVELPGIDDPERVRDIIQSTSRLEVHSVEGQPGRLCQRAGSADVAWRRDPARRGADARRQPGPFQ